MKTLIRVLFVLLLTTIQVFWEELNNNVEQDSNIESQITPESSSEKIKKLQTLFKELKLYEGQIDWVYSSIEDSLISYQIKAWIVSHREDWWAGYFWRKTINALKQDYADEFEKSAKTHLKMVIPDVWKREFIVTAYYSPLPWQYRYITWSYRGDIKLNWWWKVTASGKWVFPWLLAAPRNYPFWTRIYLEWIWVWSVEDRWWAIVNAWERWHESDRIDVWMGYWDEWLSRALKWWKRTVSWEILEYSEEVSMEFEKSPFYKTWEFKASPYSSRNEIINLQTLFSQLELYSWEIDWNYESIKPNLIQFQIDNWIIASRNAEDAWWFWPKTVSFIREKYTKWIFVEKIREWNILETFWLSLKDREKVEKLKDKLEKSLWEMASWDQEKLLKYKERIKIKLDRVIDKQEKGKNRDRLKYLNKIL